MRLCLREKLTCCSKETPYPEWLPPAGGAAHMQGGQRLRLAGGTDPVSSSLVLGHPEGSALICGQRGYEGRPAPFHQAHPRSSSQPKDLHLASRGAGKCHWSPAPPQGRRPHGQQEDTGGAVSHRAAAPALWWQSQVTPTLCTGRSKVVAAGGGCILRVDECVPQGRPGRWADRVRV